MLRTKLTPLTIVCLLGSACGDRAEEGNARDSVVTATDAAAFQGTSCLMGTDEDGDGVTDYFVLSASNFINGLSPTKCFAAGGTVFETRWRDSGLTAAPPAAVSVPPPTTTTYTEGGNIPQSVRQIVAAGGIHNRPYNNPNYDCDDYANDLEILLTNEGYNATYTEICHEGPPEYWHAITDLHLGGKTYWIDAMTGKQIKLDQNADGEVDSNDAGKPCASDSEGDWGVRVWDNLGDRIVELGSPDVR